MHKRCNDCPVRQSPFAQQPHHLARQIRCQAFEFHLDLDRAAWQIQHLGQRRNPFAAEFSAEMRPGVQRLSFCQVQFVHRPAAISRAIHQSIVQHHRVAVP